MPPPPDDDYPYRRDGHGPQGAGSAQDALYKVLIHNQQAIAMILLRIEQTLEKLMTESTQAFQELTDKVAADTTLDQSAATFIEGLKAALDAAIAANDPAALRALSAQLGANQDALSQAIVANTPAAPAAP